VSVRSEKDLERGAPPVTEALDDELCLMFLCCHPVLPRGAQIALTLRVAYGFTTAQIARGFLSGERTISQRIVRAKERLRSERVRFELPTEDELPSRLEAILDVIYQLFTEGHASRESGGLDRALCEESLRLTRLLTAQPRTSTPSAHALRALICFHQARAATRVAEDGSLLLLQEQARGRWDEALLAEGFEQLDCAARGELATRFHFEAGIAACHAAATSFATTDWIRILELYDGLRDVAPSPIIEINRAFALAMCQGARAGIDELDAIPERELIERYPYGLATYAELHASLGETEVALGYLDRALLLQSSRAEHALLVRKRAALASR